MPMQCRRFLQLHTGNPQLTATGVGSVIQVGKTIRMTLRPAGADHGVVFRRIGSRRQPRRDLTSGRVCDRVVETASVVPCIGNAAGVAGRHGRTS